MKDKQNIKEILKDILARAKNKDYAINENNKKTYLLYTMLYDSLK
jgi:hypothetical protein